MRIRYVSLYVCSADLSMQAWFREFMKNRARPGIRIRARLDSRRQIEDRAMMTDAKADSAALEGPSGPPLSRFERQRGKILDAATMLLNQRGIAGMTLQEVAEQLGQIGRGAVGGRRGSDG